MNISTLDIYTHIYEGGFTTPKKGKKQRYLEYAHQKLFGGRFSTPCPLFCLICTISFELNGQMDVYQNTPHILAARSFLVAGFDTRLVPRRFWCGMYM